MTRPQSFSADSNQGFTIVELVVAMSVFVIVLGSVVPLFLSTSRAFSSLASRAQLTARAQVVTDRLVEELLGGSFTLDAVASLEESNRVRFQRVVDFVAGAPVFGNPIQIEAVPAGAVDELRIWEDMPPYGVNPGPEDSPVVIEANVAKNGLTFKRFGAILLFDLTLQKVTEPGQPPTSVLTTSGVNMRNNFAVDVVPPNDDD